MGKASELKLKEIRISMGMFDFDVICVVGNYENAVKYSAWKFEDDFVIELGESSNKNYKPRGKCFFRAGYVPVIWMPQRPKTPREIATLAHECLHAVFHLLDWAAIPATRDTEEVITHAQAHLVTNILTKTAQTKSAKGELNK